MTHKLKVHLAPAIPDDPGIVAAQTKTLRERLLCWLLGAKHPITILVPGNSVKQIDIQQHQAKDSGAGMERLTQAVLAQKEEGGEHE